MNSLIPLYIVSLLPVIIFILALIWLDSFSLLKKRYLILAFFWGGICVVISYFCGGWISKFIPIKLLVAPIFEEFLKGLFVLFLIKSNRSAFFIDALIYGVAVGAGFAFFENIKYVSSLSDMSLGTAIIRGVGTAIMHCGAVAGTAAILSWTSLRTHHTLRYYILALIPAMILHSLYNALLLPPYLSLVIIVVGVTMWIIILIFHNENSIGKWLEVEMVSEVELLKIMQKGEFTDSRMGKYMMTIREQFSPEIFLDMYCYIRVYLELSLLCKRNMMLAEVGMNIPKDDTINQKIKEFKALKKQIGKTGELALAPIIKQDRLLKWKIKSMIQN